MILDFRSDTVTHPTQAMRQAMANAEVGDDVLGEDPTVCQLEQEVAELLGKEAALFVPSGTMGNQLAILSQTESGNEILLAEASHIIEHEAGGAALLSRVQTRPLSPNSPHLLPEDVERAVRKERDIHYPKTTLMCLEQATGCGTVVDLKTLAELHALAKKWQLSVHMDGARLFNAATALNCEPHEITVFTDTVTVCLSKGLSAPVGSVLAGQKTTIERARNFRKILGGGMRQVGVLAAAGRLALNQERHRLGEDHQKAQRFRNLLSATDTIDMPYATDINMVFVDIRQEKLSGKEIAERLLQANIKSYPDENGIMRFVFHRQHTIDDVEKLARNLLSILDRPCPV